MLFNRILLPRDCELMTLQEQGENINLAVFSTNVSKIISGGYDSTIKIWDSYSGNKVRIFRGHTDNINLTSFCLDSIKIVSGSRNNSIKICDTSSPKEVAEEKGIFYLSEATSE